MKLNLNNLLIGVSNALDFVEMDILGVNSNHSKRVAYICLKIALELNLTPEESFDIVALSILHDNGLSEKVLHNNINGNYYNKLNVLEKYDRHCIIGEENIKEFPFLTDVTNVIKYHHERFDGSGFFDIKGNDIPIMAQIISFADTLDLKFTLNNMYKEKEEEVLSFLKREENKLVSSEILSAFYKLINIDKLWVDLQDEFLDKKLNDSVPCIYEELNYERVKEITRVLSRIIDCKSKFTAEHSLGLSTKIKKMADYYKKDEVEKLKLSIAADLHDIGKLAIPNEILDKDGKLTKDEYELIKTHSHYTRACLDSLDEFEDIAEWASNHHEKLNGSGYPKGLTAESLDFNSRLMACLDIYQALVEERPYRVPLSHQQSMDILYNLANDNLIDKDIITDMDFVFGNMDI